MGRSHIELPGYVIAERGGWDFYIAEDNKILPDEGEKFHISVRNDADTLNEAFKLIAPILKEYKIEHFKRVNPDAQTYLRIMKIGAPELVSDLSNLDGKAFCVWLLPLNKDPVRLAEMIQRIEKALKEGKIAFHPKGPLGDGLLPGSIGYIYFRNPCNVAGRYVSAHTLKNNDFTRKEAQFISETAWHTAVSARLQSTAIEEKENKEIKQTEIKLEPRDFSDEAPDLKKTISLSWAETRIKDAYKEMLGEAAKVWMGSFRRDETDSYDKLQEFLKENKKLNDHFDFEHFLRWTTPYRLASLKPYLKAAAKQITMVHEMMVKEKVVTAKDIKKLSIGNISPALYYHFFKPIWHAYQQDKNVDIAALIPKYVDHQKLVREIVKCSLRDAAYYQIWRDVPLYVFGLSEIQVDCLVDRLPHPFARPRLPAISSSMPAAVTRESEATTATQGMFSRPFLCVVPDDILLENIHEMRNLGIKW